MIPSPYFRLIHMYLKAQAKNPSHHDRIPLWLPHFIWQVHYSKASFNPAIQFRLVVEQLPLRWGVVRHVYDNILLIDTTELAPTTA